MTIKPDQLCIIKGSLLNDGKIVTLLKVFPPGHDDNFTHLGPVGLVDTPLTTKDYYFKTIADTYTLPLVHLKPLDNPPDDAVDETLLWLDVPKKELENV